jgi:tetratricopeptide (TPR) repeat protein
MSKSKRNQKSNERTRSETKAKKKWSSFSLLHFIAIGLIVAAAFVGYSNTFHVPFQFDDRPNIINNPNIQIKVLTWDQLERLVRNTYQETIRVFSYLTLALSYYLGEFDVSGYHLMNLLIHIASGIFLYGFLILTFNLPSLRERYGSFSFKLSLLTSLIFIVHPIQTQSVTYIVQRMASMAGMFYLLTMVLYVKGRLSHGNRRWGYFVAAGLTYLLGIFSKENVAILPIFILIYEFYFFQNLTLSSKGKKTFLSVAVIVGLIGLLGLVVWGKRYYELIIEGYKIRDFTLGERVLTQFRVVLYYLTLLAYPHPSRLNLDYDFPTSKTLLDPPMTLISIIIVGGLIGYSIFSAKKRPVLSFCILWYFGNLVIESSIFPLEMVYEHRLYLPALGPFLLFSLIAIQGLEKLKQKHWFKKILSTGKGSKTIEVEFLGKIKANFIEISFFSVILLLLLVGTYARNSLWNNEIELWKDCVKKSPQKSRPHVNLGFAYYEAGDYAKAYAMTQRAIELKPNNAEAHHNLGIILQKMGDLSKAAQKVKESLQIDPELHMALYSLGSIYFENGQFEESADAFEKFLKIYPYFPNVHHLLAIVYASQKNFDKAVEEFEWELKINPYHTLAHLNLGQIYWYEFQNKRKALYHLKAALALDPFLPNQRGIQNLVSQLEKLP